MNYTESHEKKVLKSLMYSLKTASKKDHLEQSLQDLFEEFDDLQHGESYKSKVIDILQLADLLFYYEGVLAGAKLLKLLLK